MSNKNPLSISLSKSQNKIEVGISACLIGMPVRYNGGHSQSKLCLQTLNQYFNWRSFCPEVMAGFSTPRPSMRLVGNPDSPQLINPRQPEVDLTSQLIGGFSEHLDSFSHLHGYILMKNSPSCGMERVKVYQTNGHPHPLRRQGLFAQALQARYPLMPIEEEGRLHDAHLLENFVMRVYVHYRYQRDVMNNTSIANLLAFHSQHKYLLMAHNPETLKRMGQLLSQPHQGPSIASIATQYFRLLMSALSKPATRSKQTNVLQHLLGHLRRHLTSTTRQHLVAVINRYRIGELPLAAPLTLLQHYLTLSDDAYLKQQHYFSPYPDKLGLANHV
ncbi:MAG: DUF1722 domain-containing protein [Gammaproteobacteria bacterium]|nr:DUF1722 domain-containing protein [Gammaproteobacteria bacterium]